MTISIWWLVGLSQFTLCILIVLTLIFLNLKVAKKQTLGLRSHLQKTTDDYKEFIKNYKSTVDSSEAVSTVIESSQVLLSQYQEIKQTQEDYESDATIEDASPTELPATIELHFLATLITDKQFLAENPQAARHWQILMQGLTEYLQTTKIETMEYTSQLTQVKCCWLENKPSIDKSFENAVKLSQQLSMSEDIHTSINDVYNRFVTVLNTVPGLQADKQDALLQMEATSNVELDETDPLNEQSLDDIEFVDADLSTTSDDVLQIDIDSELDDISVPPPAIAEFDAIASENVFSEDSQTNDVSVKIDEGGAVSNDISDDIFDDLLAAMDEVLEAPEIKQASLDV